MKRKAFHLPMNQTESIVGWVYVFVHTFAMTFLLAALNNYIFPRMGFQLSETNLNLLYYIVGFLFLLAFLFHFWRESFADMCGAVPDTLIAVIVGYVAYVLLMNLVSGALGFFLKNLTNPNSAAVIQSTKLNPNKMIVIGVLLAPVVEETLFRGVVFGTIRRSSRLAAYIVSALFFSVYHLWSYFLYQYAPSLFLYLLQYIPAGLVLAWCMERGRSFWASVFLHMIINYVSITVTIG